MKKYLPFIILGVGILVVVLAIVFFVRKDDEEVVEENIPEIPLEKRPLTSLIPSSDGHWLKLVIGSISVEGAKTMDYELLYTLPDGRTQGVPGTINISGNDKIERDLLLGSESSGKFRYDEGVENGTLSLKFRNDKGKLVGKLETDWVLSSKRQEFSSKDSKFIVKLAKDYEDVFFLAMSSFGLPKAYSTSLKNGPYALFTSYEDTYEAEISLAEGETYIFAGDDWEKLEDGFEFSDSSYFFISI